MFTMVNILMKEKKTLFAAFVFDVKITAYSHIYFCSTEYINETKHYS